MVSISKPSVTGRKITREDFNGPITLTGTPGKIVSFDDSGNAIEADMPVGEQGPPGGEGTLPGLFNVKSYGALGDGSTDDTAGIQAGIDSVYAAGGGTLYFPPGTYIVGGALQDTSYSNAQLLLPKVTDITEGPVIRFLGPVGGGNTFSGESGAIVKSTLASGNGAMLGVKTDGQGSISRMSFYAENITFRMPENPTNSCLDLSYLPFIQLTNVRIDVPNVAIAGPAFDIAEPTTASSYGIKGPLDYIPSRNLYYNVCIVGYYTGIRPGELWGGDALSIFGCKWGIEIPTHTHAGQFGYILICNTQNLIKVTGSAELHIDMLAAEHNTAAGSGPSWVEGGVDIDDPSNGLHGTIRHAMHDPTPWTVNGGRNIKFLTARQPLQGNGRYEVFSGFNSLVSATSCNELKALEGEQAVLSLLADTPTTGGAALGSILFSNLAGPGANYRAAQIYVSTGSAARAGRLSFLTADASGGFGEHLAIDENGYVVCVKPLVDAANNSAAATAGVPLWGLYRNSNQVMIRSS